MDRDKIIGLLVILGLFAGLIYYNTNIKTPEVPDEETPTVVDENEPPTVSTPDTNSTDTPDITPADVPDAVVVSNDSTQNYADSLANFEAEKALANRYGVFGVSTEGEEQFITVENEVMIVTLTSKGGGIHKLELKNYKTGHGGPVYLVNEDSWDFNYTVSPIVGSAFQINDFYFESETDYVSLEGKDTAKVTLALFTSSGERLFHEYTFTGNTYEIDFDIDMQEVSDLLAKSSRLDVDWKSDAIRQEVNLVYERRYAALYYRYRNDDVENLGTTKESKEEELETAVSWIAYKTQFFNTTLFVRGDKGGFTGDVSSFYEKDDTTYLKQYASNISAPIDEDNKVRLKWFTGPNQYNTLKEIEPEFKEIIQLSPDFFLLRWAKVFSQWMFIPMFDWLNNLGLNFGLIILLLAVLIKVVTYPLTVKTYKSQAVMKLLKPDLDKLKEKYKDDQQKLGTEQFKLYGKAGVNPLSGCIPMLIQMPLLISMYYFFPASIELRQEEFLWATDLSTYDSILSFKPINFLFLNIDHISLFTLLMSGASVLSSLTNPQMAGAGAGPNQQLMKYMPYIMPVFLFFIFNNFPAALTFYYFLFNLLTVIQQFVIKKFFIDEEKLRKQIEERKSKPQKKSKWQQRLEDLQKEQKKQSAKNRRDRRKN